jgi:hypothetical protein
MQEEAPETPEEPMGPVVYTQTTDARDACFVKSPHKKGSLLQIDTNSTKLWRATNKHLERTKENGRPRTRPEDDSPQQEIFQENMEDGAVCAETKRRRSGRVDSLYPY